MRFRLVSPVAVVPGAVLAALVLAAGCGGPNDGVVDSSGLQGPTTTIDPNAGEVAGFWPMHDTTGEEMVDASGNGHVGVAGALIERTGESYRFPEIVPNVADVSRIAVVKSSPEFDSGDRPLTVSFRIRMTSEGEHNVVQKGQSQAPGGFWKIEVNANGQTPGIAHCTFKGVISTSAVSAEQRIDDGKWHTVACRRTRLGLSIDVDGEVRVESALTGAMSNTSALSIAGKAKCNPAEGVECDYFVGELSDLKIVIG
jgi:hypothetical protein